MRNKLLSYTLALSFLSIGNCGKSSTTTPGKDASVDSRSIDSEDSGNGIIVDTPQQGATNTDADGVDSALFGANIRYTADPDVPRETSDARLLVDKETTITLDRGVCLGERCPSYSLIISGEGMVTYEGRKYVSFIGTATGQISIAQVQSLVDFMELNDYLSLTVPAICARQGTDQPWAVTSLKINGSLHIVEHPHNNLCAPEALTSIENLIDLVAESDQWVKGKQLVH